ncbi:hypothetical protein N7495_008572 [Penicillium taxi]|uniref:uncharacterized protein n=1 Tax=Penicillium taxi TaxID=168475 RepID=UPI0025455E95|nr:uncharacterized protein N7495_008572 [Penicillium taxi]KAJ5888531.1 hypothetical protein N7495_008572 [Penicillium taxi]
MPVSQFRRKNGQQSSCETCRKSKLACDHAVPHCGRCVRLNRTDTCIYVANPLTACSPKSTAVEKRQTKSKYRRENVMSMAQSPIVRELSTQKGMFTTDTERILLEPSSSKRMESLDRTTSWGKIFDEFNIDIESEDMLTSPSNVLSTPWKDQKLFENATIALTQIPSQELCEGLINHAVKYPDFGCHDYYLRLLHDAWWDQFEGFLEVNLWSMSSIEPIIEQLWTNTVSRVNKRLSTDSVEWLSSWVGPNTTWDSLAHLISAYGSAYASMLPSNPLLAHSDKSQVCRDIGKGVKACLFICETMDITSVNVVNAHANMVLLQQSYDSNDSKHNYTNVGHLVRNVIYMSINPGSTFKCFIQTELERKAFHRATILDNSVSTSCGRLPQLTRRFDECPLPLELSDEQLLLSIDELDNAIGLLDSNGWAPGESSYPVSYLRALSMMGNHRREILELTMGSEDEPPENLQKLSCSIPLSQNESLLSSAKATINVMTMLYTHRHRLEEMSLFFPWAVMFYGTPAAAILAIELLLRQYSLTGTPNSGNSHPRSEIIQELSVFISCLKSMPSTEGNHTPCRRVASTLQKILDQVLDSSTLINSTTSRASPTMASFVTKSDPSTDWDIDWKVFFTGPCDPDYTQWLDPSTWIDNSWPLEIIQDV